MAIRLAPAFTTVPDPTTAGAPIVPMGPGAGMPTAVGQESVFDSLNLADFWEQHYGKIIAGGLLLVGAGVYYYKTR